MTAPTSKCLFVAPHPRWIEVLAAGIPGLSTSTITQASREEQENWTNLQSYLTHLLRDCLPTPDPPILPRAWCASAASHSVAAGGSQTFTGPTLGAVHTECDTMFVVAEITVTNDIVGAASLVRATGLWQVDATPYNAGGWAGFRHSFADDDFMTFTHTCLIDAVPAASVVKFTVNNLGADDFTAQVDISVHERGGPDICCAPAV